MTRPKGLKAYVDSDFPDYVFCLYNNEVRVYKEIHKSKSKQRDIEHFFLIPKNATDSRKRNVISEQRILAAMEMERDVLDVRYISKNKCYRVKKNAVLLGLIKAKKELSQEHPNIDIDSYIDDAYLKIINSGYIPTDYDDIKEVILRTIVAIKIEREHKKVSMDKVEYKLQSDKEEHGHERD